ncbi:hypothetical protein N0V93_010040 [Gnomoniopsis smithogilvyi]|uniref:Uncharacterized protein n=1 Tax=Gnomoniopsis smithogilvyi TaxID=1191159 RepID=A0A9W8YJA6_9PEZI|nr:hypothetical protein N0V93_010040 [Gnomoniopsis smithogilvyi]
MTSNNPRHKPLHHVRTIRNASRNAKQFPQLAEHLFNPSHARATFYDPLDPKWDNDGEGGIVAPIGMPPQPTMQQFYSAPTAGLYPRPFASQQDLTAHNENAKTAGFVPFIKNGTNQFKAMMQLGLDPRLPPTEEELRRREEDEVRIQVFRDRMTVETIIENSGGGKWRKQGPFPGWNENLSNQGVVKALTDKKVRQSAGAKQKAERRAKAT